MAHGTPDWGRTAGTNITYQLTDLGELAARLGSIVTFDRRGDVVWLDDFESTTLKWEVITMGTGSSAARTTNSSYRGDGALELVTGDVIGNHTDAERWSGRPPNTRVGLELHYASNTIQGLDLEAHLAIYDGAQLHLSAVRVDVDTGEVQYRDSGGSWVTAITFQALAGLLRWWHLKFVIDLEADEYLRLIFNDTEVDLSGVAIEATASITSPAMFQLLRATTQAATNKTFRIDDVIVTQNEP